MSTTQATPEQTPAQTTAARPRSVFDDIIENHSARAQAEQAKADKICAQTYSEDPQAYTIALGRDYGLGTAHSLQMIWVDPKTGKPNLYAGARATFLQQAGYDWLRVTFTDEEVTLRFTRNGELMKDAHGKPLDVTYTMKDAERADLPTKARGANAKPGDKGNYDKHPKNMLYARCISNFHRWFAPHVMGATVYDRGEVPMDDIISATEARMESRSAAALDKLEATLTAAPEVASV